LFADHGDRATAIVWESPDGATVLLPIIRRPIPAGEPDWANLDDRGWTDAVSPYGYGGPFASSAVDWASFYAAVLKWMRAEGVISTFVRASLGHTPPRMSHLAGYEALSVSDNVILDLTRTSDDQWKTYAHKVRKNVNKATRAGLRVEIHPGFRQLEVFIEILHATLRRRDAADRYYFPMAFFRSLSRALPENLLVADVREPEGRTISTELVLQSSDTLYSFLGGTRQEAFPLAPNDLLKHAVVEYGRRRGMKRFVLGGGYAADDGIFRYKRSFDPGGVVPFFGIRLIGHPEIYEALRAAKTRVLERKHPGSFLNEAFFPVYRDSRVQ
jgi:hypothetical protein